MREMTQEEIYQASAADGNPFAGSEDTSPTVTYTSGIPRAIRRN